MQPLQAAVSSTSTPAASRPSAWSTWAPREAIAPVFRIDDTGGRNGGPALVIEGHGRPDVYGEWHRQIDGLTGGALYRFTAHRRAHGVTQPRRQVIARIEWLTSGERYVSPPIYALDVDRQDEWLKCEHLVQAPLDARSALIRLGLRWSPNGTVWWDDVSLRREAAAPKRLVRLATVHHRPRNTPSPAASVAEFVNVVSRHASRDLDLICLPEGIALVGTGMTYADVAEPVPGPTTATLSRLAVELGCYIVAALYERVGSTLYNTAVLLDRQGELVGTYRKTHLPQSEADGGLTPGDDYPVFDTDFGRVGILICWDLHFPESARAMASRGAEVLLIPIWGGNEVLARARAIENHLVVVTSSFDMRPFIVDPTGQVLAEAGPHQPLASATVDLAQPILQPWLGDMKTSTWTELRSDL